MSERFVISWTSAHYADADWTQFADRWKASFYTKVDPVFGTAVITRVIPGVTPNPRRAFEADPGVLDRIPRVIFDEEGGLVPAVAELRPSMVLLLESVEVEEGWRGKGVGTALAMEALRRLAIPGTLAVCYPAPIHPQHGPGEVCSYESDDPEVRRADEEAVVKLRRAWERHGFELIADGVYGTRVGPA